MRIIDKYIFKSILTSYLFILLVLIGLYYLGDIFSTLTDILQAKPSMSIVISYYLNMFPVIFLKASPFSLLISVLYTFGELNKSNEIVGARAAGTNIIKLVMPAIMLAVILSCTALFVQEKVLIHSQRKVERLKLLFIKKSSSLLPEEKNIVYISGDTMFYCSKFLTKKNILRDVIIFKGEGKNLLAKKIVAKQLTYKDGLWHGKDVLKYTLDKKGKILDIPSYQTNAIVDLNEPPHEIMLKKNLFTQFTSLKTLKKEINWLTKIKASALASNLKMEYYRKIVEPFTHIFLVIGVLAIALEIRKRKVALSALGMGFIFGFLYYFLLSISLALGKSGMIIPELSIIAAPLFFLSLGIAGLTMIK